MELCSYFSREPAVSICTFGNQAQIMTEGLFARNLLIIKKGYALPYRVNEEGQEVGLGLIGPNGIYGSEIFKDELVYNKSLKSIGDCEVLKVPSLTFSRVVSENPELRLMILQQMAKQASTAERMVKLTLVKAPERTAISLLQMVDQMGNTLFNVDHYDIAINAAGIAKETTCRIIDSLKEIGVVSECRGTINITNIDILKEVARGRLHLHY